MDYSKDPVITLSLNFKTLCYHMGENAASTETLKKVNKDFPKLTANLYCFIICNHLKGRQYDLPRDYTDFFKEDVTKSQNLSYLN